MKYKKKTLFIMLFNIVLFASFLSKNVEAVLLNLYSFDKKNYDLLLSKVRTLNTFY